MSRQSKLMPWKVTHSRREVAGRVFTLRTDIAANPRNGEEHPFQVLESPDWVNVVAVTNDDQVVLIRQYRFGTGEVTLEIPGGIVEPRDTPMMAAVRELREETGYVGDKVTHIGSVRPNPAFINNTCHTFLVENVFPDGAPDMDSAEDIEVVLRPLDQIPELVAQGLIDHALVLNALTWYLHPDLRPVTE